MPVDTVDVRLADGPHPYETANLSAIDANWQVELAANPAFHDGQVVLLSSLALEGRRLAGECHAIRYATFLHWRKSGAVAGAEHAFANAMLVSSDNALVAIRMGNHTAGAGKVYFAAGSFEPVDFPGGIADLHLNMAREVGEETGLSLDGLHRDPSYHIVSLETGTVIFRRYFLTITASEAVARIERFVATEEEPEIQGAVIIRDARNRPAALARHMPYLLDWHFLE